MTDARLTAVQTVIRGVSDFADPSVVINDWSFLDGTRDDEPWSLIESAGLLQGTFDIDGDNYTWLIPVSFIIPYSGDWGASRAELTRLRTAVLDYVSGDNTSLPGVGDGKYRSVNRITDVNPNEPVQPVLTEAFLEALASGDAIPDYLQLQTVWEVAESC